MTKRVRIRKSRAKHPAPVRLVTAEELPGKLFDLLCEAGYDRHQLAVITGWSTATVDTRLQAMYDDDIIHRKAITTSKGGVRYVYHAGPSSSVVHDLPKQPVVSDMRQSIVQTWAPLNFRCELETYLFGPAQREAA